MTKPTNYPEVASGSSTLPTAGTDNKIEPNLTIKTVGWDQSQKPAAQNINYIFDLINQWIQYFDGLTDGSTLAKAPEILYSNTFGAETTLDLATIFSTNPTFKYFKVVVEDCVPVTGGDSLCLRASIDGSTFRSTAGDYDWAYVEQDSSAAGVVDNESNNDTKIILGSAATTSDNGIWVVKVNNPHDATKTTSLSYNRELAAGSTKVVREYGVGGFLATVDDITGFQLLWSTADTFAAGATVTVLGSDYPF